MNYDNEARRLLGLLEDKVSPSLYKEFQALLDKSCPKDIAELWYPDMDNRDKAVQVTLYHVRAADDLRISYDFHRDGWVIEQASCFEFLDLDNIDEGWKEVAFCEAWQCEDESKRISRPPEKEKTED